MKLNLSRTYIALVAAALASCAKDPNRAQPEVPQRAPVAQFAGLTFPGGMKEAKAGGFKDCEVDYYHMTCSLSAPPALLGVQPAVARVSLDKSVINENGFVDRELVDVRTVPPHELRYHTIELQLGKTSHILDCMEAAVAQGSAQSRVPEPTRCLDGRDTAGHLLVALEQKGWVRIISKRFGDVYAHANEAYTITLQDETATLSVADRSVVTERLAELGRRTTAEQAAQSNGAALAEQMRQ